MKAPKSLGLLLALALAGCSSNGNGVPDAGDEAGPDAHDAASDPGDAEEPVADADDGGDAPDGTSGDDGGEMDAGDAGPHLPWPWCPDASAYHGDEWEWTIRAEQNAIYCVFCEVSADSSTLGHELARKGELLIVPGDYPLPSSPGDYAYRLPVCLNFVEPLSRPLLGDVGTMNVSRMVINGTDYLHFMLEQPMQTSSGAQWLFSARLSKPEADGETVMSLDGSLPDPLAGIAVAFKVCESPCEFGMDLREFASCHFEGVPVERHRLVFEGGQVDLNVRISPGYTMAGQLPALFDSADGELDGQAFRQEDYWKLAFTGGIQHYLNRHFLFLFDTPIGPACGLKAENLDVWISDPPARLTTINCDMTEIEERTISDEFWEELP